LQSRTGAVEEALPETIKGDIFCEDLACKLACQAPSASNADTPKKMKIFEKTPFFIVPPREAIF
jgi:hypothetical protein